MWLYIIYHLFLAFVPVARSTCTGCSNFQDQVSSTFFTSARSACWLVLSFNRNCSLLLFNVQTPVRVLFFLTVSLVQWVWLKIRRLSFVTARQTPRQSRWSCPWSFSGCSSTIIFSAITCCILGTKKKVATTKIETAIVSTSSRKKIHEIYIVLILLTSFQPDGRVSSFCAVEKTSMSAEISFYKKI